MRDKIENSVVTFMDQCGIWGVYKCFRDGVGPLKFALYLFLGSLDMFLGESSTLTLF
jgi:hypothetical protein